ncbi:MAG: hypothetical protein IJX67_04865 [Oscillospiraceae bacterium]|nr:hypothetical protein [Oscillospiraceae bacterium]
MSNTIESLEIEIIGSSQSAEQALDALERSLGRLKTAVKGGCGLTAVTNQLTAMNTALGSMNSSSISNLKALADGLNTLSGIGKFKLSSSIANQITSLGTATKSLNGTDFTQLTTLATALTPLATVGKANLGSTINQLGKLPGAIQPLVTMDMTGLSQKIRDLVEAVKPLSEMGKANLGSTLNQIKKLPEAFATLNALDLTSFAKKIKEVAAALAPLADEMQKVANGFSAFPAKIQKLLNATNQIPKANARAGTSYVNLAAKITMAYAAVKRIASVIASWINKSNEYIENLNLFTVAMGEYATEAQKYAEMVGELMGIDPGEWMRNQGVFMTLATGFGVASDRAYTMSQNLTQLGYDLSSFFNITFEDAMQKLQSGISGELEPLRRLGYDLSQARLEAVALSLGIDKAVSSMTQAEKAELRYYAIMTQVTTAQGDMARTLNAPANQLRVLQAQATQAARALGNIFIPALNAVLPYAIAVAQVIRFLANTIASLFGFSLPEVDYSGIGELAGGASDASDAIDDTTGSVKKLKKSLLGIDELNLLTDNSDSGGGGSDFGGGGGGFDFELPEYDFLGELANSRVAQIVEEMKEWLGLTEDINSWSELMDTRFGHILKLVGSISAGIALWKLSKAFLAGIAALKALLESPTQTITLGLALTLTGFAIEFSGVADAIENGLEGFNFAEILTGGLLGTGGAAILGKGIASWITTAFSGSAVAKAITAAAAKLGVGSAGAIGAVFFAGIAAVIAGIPMVFTGIYDAIVNGLDWLNGVLIPVGTTLIGGGVGAIIGSVIGSAVAPGIGTLIGLAVGLLVDGIILLVQNWEAVCTWFQGVFATIGQFFADLWQSICDIWSVCAEWFDTTVIQPVVGFFGDLWADISSLASECWEAIVDFFSPAIEWFSQLFSSVYQTLSDIFYNIGVIASGCWEVIKAVWAVVSTWFNTNIIQPVSTFFSNMWTGIKTWAIDAWNGIKSVFSTIGSWINTNIIQPVGNFFSGLWTGFLNGARSAWEGVKTVFGNVASFFKDTFQKAWQGIVNVFSVAGEIFVNIKDGILSGFKKVVNGIIGGLNSAIAVPFNGINSALRTIKNINILGLTPFSGLRTISVPSIPYLADGGMVNAGQMFVAREAGPELVGTIGNRTAVVNNDQIVASVSQGVYEANSEQNALLREQNNLLRKLLEKDTNVTAVVGTGDVISGFERKNRRDGRTVVPVGV